MQVKDNEVWFRSYDSAKEYCSLNNTSYKETITAHTAHGGIKRFEVVERNPQHSKEKFPADRW